MDQQHLIEDRLRLVPPLLRAYIQSEEPTVLAETFASTYEFDDIKIAVLENGIVLFLLGLLDRPMLASFISTECRLPAAEANTLVAGIVQVLPQDIRLMVGGLLIDEDTLASEISAAEAVLAQLPKSSASSPQNEVTYTSTQSAILQEGSNTPPQWGGR
jgi:hypothetical protein